LLVSVPFFFPRKFIRTIIIQVNIM